MLRWGFAPTFIIRHVALGAVEKKNRQDAKLAKS